MVKSCAMLMLSYVITACVTAQWDVPDILLNTAVTAVKNRGSIGIEQSPSNVHFLQQQSPIFHADAFLMFQINCDDHADVEVMTSQVGKKSVYKWI